MPVPSPLKRQARQGRGRRWLAGCQEQVANWLPWGVREGASGLLPHPPPLRLIVASTEGCPGPCMAAPCRGMPGALFPAPVLVPLGERADGAEGTDVVSRASLEGLWWLKGQQLDLQQTELHSKQ